MPILPRPYNPAFPTVPLQKSPPLPPCGCSDPKAPETWDYGFSRLVPLLESPPVGSGILAITFFFFIAFSSNVILYQVPFAKLGIVVTLGTFGILSLVVLILFLL